MKVVPGLPEENVATTPPSVTATFLVILQGIPVYIRIYIHTNNYYVDKCCDILVYTTVFDNNFTYNGWYTRVKNVFLDMFV